MICGFGLFGRGIKNPIYQTYYLEMVLLKKNDSVLIKNEIVNIIKRLTNFTILELQVSKVGSSETSYFKQYLIYMVYIARLQKYILTCVKQKPDIIVLFTGCFCIGLVIDSRLSVLDPRFDQLIKNL